MWEWAGLVLGPSGGGTRMICVWASQGAAAAGGWRRGEW